LRGCEKKIKKWEVIVKRNKERFFKIKNECQCKIILKIFSTHCEGKNYEVY